MPLYEYECQECGYQFEIRQGYHGQRPSECPQCKGGLVQLLFPSGIIFKGGRPSKEVMHRGKPAHQTDAGYWEAL